MLLWMLRTLHHWVGAAFAAFFFVIAVSGVWLILATGMGETLSNGDFRRSVKHFTPVEAVEPIGNIAERYGAETIHEIDFPRRGRSAFLVEQTDGAALYLDQETLALISEQREGSVTPFMRDLHVELLGLAGAGKGLVVATGLVIIYLVLNGLIVFYPVRRSFDISATVRPKKVTFNAMRRSHISTGLLLSGFVFLFGLTGWVVGDRGSAEPVFQSFDAADKRPVSVNFDDVGDGFGALEGLLSTRVSAAEFAQTGEQTEVSLTLARRGEMVPEGHSKVRYILESERLVAAQDGANLGWGSRFVNDSAALHTGAGMGWPYQIVLIVAGVFSGLLTVWALMAYGLRWRRRWVSFQSKRNRRNTN